MYDVLVLAPFSPRAKEKFLEIADGKCRFTYADSMSAPIDGYDIVFGNPSQKKIINAGEKLKWVQLLSSGTDRYNTDFPDNVTLTSATGIFGESISQHVLCCILSLYRKMPRYLQLQKQHKWQISGFGKSLKGKTVLILGAGDIGCCTAKLLKAFGTYNIGVKRTVKDLPENFDEMHTLEDLDLLLPRAEIIVCCLPSTKSTVHLLDKRRFALMKRSPLIVNVGRGSLIDTSALIHALESKTLSGAALDVTEPEPLPEDSPLWDMENVIITPHISGPSLSDDGFMCDEIAQLCSDNLKSFLSAGKLINTVDLNQGYAVK